MSIIDIQTGRAKTIDMVSSATRIFLGTAMGVSLLAFGFAFYFLKYSPASTTQQVASIPISQCDTLNAQGQTVRQITGPGTYVLQNQITATLASGDCLTVNGISNVTIDGNNQAMTASRNAVSVTGLFSNFQFKNVTVIQGGLFIEAPGSANPNNYLVRNQGVLIDHVVFISNIKSSFGGIKDLVFQNNTVNGPIQFGAGYGALINAKILNNRMVSQALDLPSHQATVILQTNFNTLMEGNYIESQAPDNPDPNFGSTVIKMYYVTGSTFKNNTIFASTNRVRDGAIKMRSGSRDNYFYQNTIVAPYSGSVGIKTDTYVGNCLSDGPTGGEIRDPVDPGPHDNYTSPPHTETSLLYKFTCNARRMTYDSNLIVTGGVDVGQTVARGEGIDLGPIGKDSRLVNNVIVSPTAVFASTCEGPVKLYNNTLIGKGGYALNRESNKCSVEARNNIFFSDGAAAVTGTLAPLTGDYNLFWPVYSGLAQNHPVTGQPQFIGGPATVDINNPDVFALGWRLSANSPAVGAADTATTSLDDTWWRYLYQGENLTASPPTYSQTQDPLNHVLDLGHDNVVRPQNSLFDLGAYEYASPTSSGGGGGGGSFPVGDDRRPDVIISPD